MRATLTTAERTRLRTDAAAIFSAALRAVDPRRLVADSVHRDSDRAVLTDSAGSERAHWPLPLTVVGAGKASAAMAGAVENALGAGQVHGVVIDVAPVAAGRAIEVAVAGHPLSDARGLAATRRVCEALQNAGGDGALCLVSGGASALLVAPRSPLRLESKVETVRLLLASGCAIDELNTVRKHLSSVKGGGLLRLAAGPLASLVLSDVVGDDLGTIGSGPTSADPTTFTDAWAVLTRYRLAEHIPGDVAELLDRGCRGEIAETVKPRSPEADRCTNLLIGSNRIALDAGAAEARRRGWHVVVHPDPVVGDTTGAARRFWRGYDDVAAAGSPTCVLAGGETTVVVVGAGHGGRNQEFALALVDALAESRWLLLSAGTDGIDGPTPAAGAFVDGTTQSRARLAGLCAAEALARNDSYSFFAALGDGLVTGPTGTNVMDLKVALHLPAGSC